MKYMPKPSNFQDALNEPSKSFIKDLRKDLKNINDYHSLKEANKIKIDLINVILNDMTVKI